MNAKLTAGAILMALSVTACSSGDGSDDELLEQYKAGVEVIQGLADGYVADASTSAAVSEVASHQSTYEADMEVVLGDLEHALEDMGGCQMGDGAGRVDEAMASLDLIHGSMMAMLDNHVSHTNVEDCFSAAEAHELEVTDEVGALEAHHDSWQEMGMDCGASHNE